jgi:hypothetical protein
MEILTAAIAADSEEAVEKVEAEIQVSIRMRK